MKIVLLLCLTAMVLTLTNCKNVSLEDRAFNKQTPVTKKEHYGHIVYYEEDNKTPSRVFSLVKDNKNYLMETVVDERHDEEGKYLRQTTFGVGMVTSDKRMGFQLRVEF